MGIISFVERKYLQGQKERQARKLAEIRKGLRKMQSSSPQLRSIAKPELTRVDELLRQLRKVRSREDLRQWRSLYEMCSPAFEAALNLSRPRPGTGKRRTKSSRRK
jgi:Xaa-Pro aminopeptidase